jgi:PPOX class probable F420-dependent enzyme
MPSRRDRIQMTEAEQRRFLDAARTIILCSVGKDGVPHPMPMWFALDDDGAVLMTTFAKSQKIRNLERDPRVSLLAEAGETYAELRGVVLYGKAELEPDMERVLGVLARVSEKSTGVVIGPEAREGLRATAAKRVAVRVAPDRIVSWDHRKLGGRY